MGQRGGAINTNRSINNCRQKQRLMAFVVMTSMRPLICNAFPSNPQLRRNSMAVYRKRQQACRSSFHSLGFVSSQQSSTSLQMMSTQQTNVTPIINNKPKKHPTTGLLRQLPPLSPHTELVSRATRQTYGAIKDDPKVSNIKRRSIKRGSQTLDYLQQSLCKPLRDTVDTYKRLYKNMHPFERVVMDLTVSSLYTREKSDATLSRLLEEVHEARKEIILLSQDWISKIKESASAKEAFDFTEEGKGSLCQVYEELLGGCWGKILEIQRALRKVPMVRLDCPAVVLVGAPNVGEFICFLLMMLD
jgi:hypothetical protein